MSISTAHVIGVQEHETKTKCDWKRRTTEAVALLTRSKATQWVIALGRDVQEFERSEEWLETVYGEPVTLLYRKDIENHIEIKLDIDKKDITELENNVTYKNIRNIFLVNMGLRFRGSI